MYFILAVIDCTTGDAQPMALSPLESEEAPYFLPLCFPHNPDGRRYAMFRETLWLLQVVHPESCRLAGCP